MTFLHLSMFLWALPLASIPILLHLLTLHRLRTVELSTFRFLFDSYVQQRRQMQFLEALLAFLRTLFLLLFILVLCRPVMRNGGYWASLFQVGSGREVLMLIDCSASMNAVTQGVTAFERAKSAAIAVAERLAPEDKLTLVRVGSRPEEVISRFSKDAASIRNTIEGMKTTPTRANLFACLSQLFGGDVPERKNPMVYLFTDCQKSGWAEIQKQGLDRVLPDTAQMIVVNVGSSEPKPNLAVIGTAPRRNRVVIGLPVVLHPKVANYSKTEATDVTLSVFMDEKEIFREQITVKPGDPVTRKVVFRPTEPGVHKGRFQVAGKTPDAFPDDDHYDFTLSVVERVKVILVNGNPAAADPLDNEALYLKAALTAEGEERLDEKDPKRPGGKLTPVDRELIRSLEVIDVPEHALNKQTLDGAGVVILANCGGLQQHQTDAIRQFVTGGGGLLIFPGDRVTPPVYNGTFFSGTPPQYDRLTSVEFQPAVGDVEKADAFERFAEIDFAHSAFSVFDDPDGKYLKSVRVYRHFPLRPAKKHQPGQPVVTPGKPAEKQEPKPEEQPRALVMFARSGPALVESQLGDGTVLLAAFPANTRWTNLPLKPEFVPLVLRMVSYVEHRPEVEVPSVVPANGIAEVAVTAAWAPASGKVIDNRNRTTLLEFQRAGSRLVAAFENTVENGYYTVEVQGARADRPRTLAFAVNLAPEESDLTAESPEQIKKLLVPAVTTVVDATAEAQQTFNAIGSEEDSGVWGRLIWLLFPIIIIEFLMATGSGGKAQTDDDGAGDRVTSINPGAWVGRMTGAGFTKETE